VLALPEDMLTDVVEVTDANHFKVSRGHPGDEDMASFRAMLAKARRPLVVLGGGGWDTEAVADFRIFAEVNNLPIGCAFRCQDLYDNTLENYVGDVGIGINPKLAQRIRESDLLIAVGARLGEMTTSGYTLIDIPVPAQKLVHVHASAEELGRVYQAALPINSGMAAFARAVRKMGPVDHKAWDNWTSGARSDYLDNIKHGAIPGSLQMGDIMAWLRERLPADAILTNGAGNYATWSHRFYQYRKYRSQLGPTNGSMGYGVPAAVAAKLAAPDRIVVSFNGDGCFMMNGQELATAVQYGANAIFLVINNGMYGTIRMHQEKTYPGRVSGTDLHNPDFVALGKAYGAHAELVETTAQFAPAFERALAAGKPALLELRLDPEAITPKASLTDLREAALKSQKP
jgi:acetolactate synthase-1/2/3 large subunit